MGRRVGSRSGGRPRFATLEAEPKDLAHRITEICNRVIETSEPSAVDVLNAHLVTMLGLKLDRSIFEGNASADPKSIRGLKYWPGSRPSRSLATAPR
jgi:hypothetical protein